MARCSGKLARSSSIWSNSRSSRIRPAVQIASSVDANAVGKAASGDGANHFANLYSPAICSFAEPAAYNCGCGCPRTICQTHVKTPPALESGPAAREGIHARACPTRKHANPETGRGAECQWLRANCSRSCRPYTMLCDVKNTQTKAPSA
jgi:hypothetical protein